MLKEMPIKIPNMVLNKILKLSTQKHAKEDIQQSAKNI